MIQTKLILLGIAFPAVVALAFHSSPWMGCNSISCSGRERRKTLTRIQLLPREKTSAESTQQESSSLSILNDRPKSYSSRRNFLAGVLVSASVVVAGVPVPAHADVVAEAPPLSTTEASITACPKPSSSGAAVNCVSTASVKDMSLYMPPWTIPPEMSPAEAKARLKGAIVTNRSKDNWSILVDTDRYLKVQATRFGAVDEMEFVINPIDHVIFFRSSQVEGPSTTDFG